MPLNKHNWPIYHEKPQPICPHCDYAIGIHKHNLEDIQIDHHSTILTCPHCSSTFTVDVLAKFTYTTEYLEATDDSK